MSESKETSQTRKKGRALYLGLAIPILLALAGFLLVQYANPQWHPKLYAYQAKNAENQQLNPPPNFTGSWNNWDQDGRLKSTYLYTRGKRDGAYVVYTPTGDVLSEGQYKAGQLDGLQKIQMEDGSRTEIPYVNGNREGIEKSWYPDGAIAVEAPWVNGEQEGSVTYYFETGAVHSSIPFYNGKKEGVHKTFHETGAPQGDEYYRDDELNGPSRFWRIDGTPEMELNYRDGKLDGIQTWYHPTGKKSREATMLLGMPNGPWLEWDEEGTLVVEEEYEMGDLKKTAPPTPENPIKPPEKADAETKNNGKPAPETPRPDADKAKE